MPSNTTCNSAQLSLPVPVSLELGFDYLPQRLRILYWLKVETLYREGRISIALFYANLNVR